MHFFALPDSHGNRSMRARWDRGNTNAIQFRPLRLRLALQLRYSFFYNDPQCWEIV